MLEVALLLVSHAQVRTPEFDVKLLHHCRDWYNMHQVSVNPSIHGQFSRLR